MFLFKVFYNIFDVLLSNWIIFLFTLAMCLIIQRSMLYFGYGGKRTRRLGQRLKESINQRIKGALRSRSPAFVLGEHSHEFYYTSVGLLWRPLFCNVCRRLMAGIEERAVSCNICRYSAHELCVPKAKHNCKPMFLVPPETRLSDTVISISLTTKRNSNATEQSPLEIVSIRMQHQWAEGNHSTVNDMCIICEMTCGSLISLSGLHCVWCQANIHKECKSRLTTTYCSLGSNWRTIVPPLCVAPRDGYSYNQMQLSLWRIFNREHFGLRQGIQKGLQNMKRNFGTAWSKLQSGSSYKRATSFVRKTSHDQRHSSCRRRRPPFISSSRKQSGSSRLMDITTTKTTTTTTATTKMATKIVPTKAIMKASDFIKIDVPLGFTPVVVFINRKSGGNLGGQLAHEFKFLLNPIQVFDLSDGGPMPGLRLFRQVPRHRIIVCGGDGTVAWVLSSIDEICREDNYVNGEDIYSPPVAIVPLGTGNDLARFLGWGGRFSLDDCDVSELLQQVTTAHTSVLDRWDIALLTESEYKAGVPFENSTKRKIMNNYLSFGFDAGIVTAFHNIRERYPNIFKSQFTNQAWYFKLGVSDWLFPSCPVEETTSVICDDVKLNLKGVQGIVILNINKYGGGSDIWARTQDEGRTAHPPYTQTQLHTFSPHDETLEIAGITNSFHMGQIQAGVSTAFRLAQGNKIVVYSGPGKVLPLQVDGEPWEQNEAWAIQISYRNEAIMLRKSCPENTSHTFLDRVGKVLDWAEANEVIEATQRITLMKEITKTINSTNI